MKKILFFLLIVISSSNISGSEVTNNLMDRATTFLDELRQELKKTNNNFLVRTNNNTKAQKILKELENKKEKLEKSASRSDIVELTLIESLIDEIKDEMGLKTNSRKSDDDLIIESEA